MQWVKRVNEKLKHRRNLSAKSSIYHAVLVAGASRVLNSSPCTGRPAVDRNSQYIPVQSGE